MRKTRQLTVLNKTPLSPNMVRITLSGDDLADFPEGQESGYVKLRLSRMDDPQKICTRSYTIRRFSRENKELDLDFVLHGVNGPASAWATHAKQGDTIAIDGPGPKKLVNMSSDWFFLVGDMTALPAIAVNLEQLPSTAKGYAVIEVISEENKLDLVKPNGVELIWVLNHRVTEPVNPLAETVKSLDWLEGEPDVWLACEFNRMREIRHYFKKERELAKDQVYSSSYWKIDATDEENKAAKKLDAEA